MHVARSDKARLELAAKVRTLTLRERGALFLANGERTVADLQQLLPGEEQIFAKLLGEGYLVEHSPAVLPPPVMVLAPPPIDLPVQAVSADNFDGKRSLATTRMFLFDICERLFVRKAPAIALSFRERLREARDRSSMMAIAEDMLVEVEGIAGPERAHGLRERIEMLLPLQAA